MPVLTPRKPMMLREPQLLVENQLPPGTYRFQLVVIDDGDNESNPAQLVVTVRERIVRPPPIFRPEVLDHIEPVDRVGPLRPEIIRPIRRPP